MSQRADPFDRLLDLADAVCDKNASHDDLTELDSVLLADNASRRCYIDYCRMNVLLQLEMRANTAIQKAFQQIDTEAAEPTLIHSDGPNIEALSAPLPTLRSPLSTSFSYFPSGWPVAYLIATVIFGIGLVIGAIVHVSAPTQVVRPSSPLPSPLSPRLSVVARITGMVDCVWEGTGFGVQGSGGQSLPSPDQPSVGARRGAGGEGGRESDSPLSTLPSSLVHLGDRLALKSGLLEITYAAGARVILQGPVTYEVESPSGGYLSVGKLTAKLEKKPDVKGQKSESAHQKSKIRNQKSPDLCPRTSDLFAIRTPTAIVTDLGTEFGVEVRETGATAAHVFRGEVDVRVTSDDQEPRRSIRLIANESIRVGKPSRAETAVVRRSIADAKAFVRSDQLRELMTNHKLKPLQRWQAYSQQLRKDPALVAYYTFESSGDSLRRLPNLSAAGSLLDGRVEGAAWVDGRLPGKFALYFRGCPGDMVVLPEQKRLQFAGAFSVAVWFKWGSFKTGKYQALIGKADTAWLLERDGHRNTLVFDTRYEPSPGADAPTAHLTPGRTDITDGRWHLAVGVYEPVGKVAKKQLYIDGRLDGENTTALPLYPNDNPVWIGANSQVAERAFYGFIDEVAMFGRALSTDEVAEMFEAGRPADSSKEQPQATTRETK